MTFTRKFSGDRSAPIVCVYTCPEHGEFDCEVQRDGRGEAPDVIACPILMEDECRCGLLCTWTPTPVASRVRRFEVVKGKWEKPERPTYLDTRRLGEGQSMEEFRAERRAVWERKRQQDVMAVKKGFG